MFGTPTESPQTETSTFHPRSPYGAAKLYAHSVLQVYRQRHGLFACSAILFNHESPRRGTGFVTRKITHGAAAIRAGLATELRLGSLDARRDWGYAGDFVRAMWLMLQMPQADDFIVATGQTHSVREFCDCAFRHVELDYRRYVNEDPQFVRPPESVQLIGSYAKAKRILGWEPEVKFQELVRMMVEADLKALCANAINHST